MILWWGGITDRLLVIQSTVDADTKEESTQTEILKLIDFCFRAFAHVPLEEKEAMIERLKKLDLDTDANNAKTREALEKLEKTLSPQELQTMNTIRAGRVVRAEDSMNIDNFAINAINGMAPNLVRGELGLVKETTAPVNYTRTGTLTLLNREAKAKAQVNEQAQHVEVSHIEVAATA